MANLSEELKIVISGDPKKFNKALDEALAGTKRLEAGLSATMKVSGVAFAALTGTVGGLVAAFRSQEIQEQKTTALLKAQGNQASVTAAQVFELAGSLQKVTTYGDDVILESQNLLLGLAKLSKDGFERASMSALDLATFMGTDATSAAQQLGKALADPNEGLSALGRAGIKFSEDQKRTIQALAQTGQTAAAQNAILDALNQRIGGLATNAANGSGRIIQLKDVIGDVGEEIGRALVPALSAAAAAAIPFFRALAENQAFTKTAATVLLVGTAIAGLTVIVAGAGLAYIKLSAILTATTAALAAQNITLVATRAAFVTAMTSVFAFTVALGDAIIKATIMTAILAKDMVIALFSFSTYKKAAAAATTLFSTAVTYAQGALGLLMTSFFATLKAIPAYVASAYAAATATATLGTAIKFLIGATGIGLLILVIADLAMNWEKRVMQMKAIWQGFVAVIEVGASAIKDFFNGIINRDMESMKSGLAKLGGAGKAFVDGYTGEMNRLSEANKSAMDQTAVVAKDQETKAKLIQQNVVFLETMKKLDDDYKNAKMTAQLTANEAEMIVDAEHRNAIVEAHNEFRNAQLEGQVEEQTLDVEQELAFQTQMQEMKNEMRAAELNAGRAAALERAQIQQKADLQFLKDREKFGVAYATINKVINSEALQGASRAAGDLVALQQSTNSTLKGIGKAAAVADITIKTAQSAMNIYNGFSTIPVIGPALGVAGAAAAIAFGAEQIGKVTAAAQGGVMTGGVPGRDSIPTLTMPGELVTPTKNFDEVVNAVADARLSARGLGAGAGAGGELQVTIGFADDAFRIIEQKLIERRVLGV